MKSVMQKERLHGRSTVGNNLWVMAKKYPIILLIIIHLLLCSYREPQTRIFDFDRINDDIGLPSGSEVFIGLLVGIVLIAIGYAILGNSEDGNKDNSGCLPVLLIGGGIVCLIPLFAWICTVAAIAIPIIIGIVVIIGIIAASAGK
jgi:hypothetical protein